MWFASKRKTILSKDKKNTISPNDFIITNSVDELFGLNKLITYLLCFCVDMF